MIGITNVALSAIRTEIGETSYTVSGICSSTLTNKWGLHRKYVTGSLTPNEESDSRLTIMQSSPYRMGHWRGYDHSTLKPGWYYTGGSPFAKAGATRDISATSIGNFTIERYEKIASVWTLILETARSWFRLPFDSLGTETNVNEVDIDEDSFPVEDGGGSNVVGTIAGDTINRLIVDLTLEIDESTLTSSREGRIVLLHPDRADTDANLFTFDFVQSGGESDVAPTTLSFNFSAQTKTVYVTVAGGDTCVVTLVSTGDGTAWFSASPTTFTVSRDVDISVLVNNDPSQRDGIVRFNFQADTDPPGVYYKSVDVGITQTGQ